jgi:cytochrome c oxidase subunit 3
VTITILFLAVIGAIVGWWFLQQRLTDKPWLEEGPVGDVPGSGASAVPAAKVGLGVLLAVVGCLFALFLTAYFMRMHMAGDWRSLPVPKMLWLNTGVLIFSSVALHRALSAANQGHLDGVRMGLYGGGISALVFLAGQLVAWRQLTAAGYFAASNPANAFFYLITGLHGLHLLGGLVALGRTIARVERGFGAAAVRLSVGLCATYWHFLLLVWLILFGVLLLT